MTAHNVGIETSRAVVDRPYSWTKRMKFFERYCTLTFGWTAIVRFWDSVNGRAK